MGITTEVILSSASVDQEWPAGDELSVCLCLTDLGFVGEVKYRILHCLAKTSGFDLGLSKLARALPSPEKPAVCSF